MPSADVGDPGSPGGPDPDGVLAALRPVADDLVVGLDFDGTLSPIVDDPTAAVIHPEAHRALLAVGGKVRAVAIITGRPAAQVLSLGDLDELGQGILAQGGQLLVFGQYGAERWSAQEGEIVSPDPPAGLAAFLAELPDLLQQAGSADAWVEHKGLAYAVHTRRLPDPQAAFEALVPVLSAAAERHGLVVEPGRMVIEIRAGGSDKGAVVRELHERLGLRGFLFGGDDLGDVSAYDEVDRLRADGLATVLVCAGSQEQTALAERADLVVDGPGGVVELLTELAETLT